MDRATEPTAVLLILSQCMFADSALGFGLALHVWPWGVASSDSWSGHQCAHRLWLRYDSTGCSNWDPTAWGISVKFPQCSKGLVLQEGLAN